MCRSPRDFEDAARDWMVCWGFADARLTSDGPDGGIDVVASGAVAQVKSWMTPIGIAEVQRLRGAAHDGSAAFFFSLMDYTDAARRFADSAGVRLFRFGGYDGSVEATNVAASAFLRELEIGTTHAMESTIGPYAGAQITNIVADAVHEAASLPGFALFGIREVGKNAHRVVIYANPSYLVTIGLKDKKPSAPLTAHQHDRLAAIGWSVYEEDYFLNEKEYSVLQDSDSILKDEYGENFVFSWRNPPELADLVSVVVRTLIEVYGVRMPEDIVVGVDVLPKQTP